jgi:hypothetical protein
MPRFDRLAANNTDMLWTRCWFKSERARISSSLPLVVVCQASCKSTVRLVDCQPDQPSNRFGNRRNSTTPGWGGLRKTHRKRTRQPAVPVAFLEKPFTAQRLTSNPVKQVRIHLRTLVLFHLLGSGLSSLQAELSSFAHTHTNSFSPPSPPSSPTHPCPHTPTASSDRG